MPYSDEMHPELCTQSFSRGSWWQISYCLV